MKKSRLKIYVIYISILILSIYFTLSYGNINEFTFIHMGVAEKIELLGHIPHSDPIFSYERPNIPGFYSFIIQVSLICNLSYDSLSYLPIQIIPLILVIFIVFRNIKEHIILYPILLIYVTLSHDLQLSFHSMGDILFFLIMASVKLYQSNNSYIKRASFIMIIISFTSLNYISYKSTCFALLFILSFILIEYFYGLKSNQNLMNNLINIFLICIIITLSFNEFIYSAAIPLVRFSYELGINPFILRIYGQITKEILGKYGFYYTFPTFLIYIKIIRLVLLGVVTIISLFYIFQRTINNKFSISFSEKMFLALLFTGLGNLFIYTLLGIFDVCYLKYAGFMAILLLYDISMRYDKPSSKKLIFLVIAILITMNLVYQVSIYTTYYNVPQKDENNFNYINPSVNWYISYVKNKDVNLKTDLLMRGYMIKELVPKNISKYPLVFSIDDILFMTQKPTTIKNYNPSNIIYGVNYRIQKSSIYNWMILKSFSYFKEEIELNSNLNKIYSTDSISFYSLN